MSAAPRLIIITDTTVAPVALMLERIEAVLSQAPAGAVAVQLRDRQLPLRERLSLGWRVRALTQRYHQRFSVNERLDLAQLLGADGAHLPEFGLEARDARQLLGPGAFLSAAWHAPGSRPPAALDAVLLSPILASRKGREPLGLEALGQLKAQAPNCHVYALGGLNGESAPDCLKAGAAGLAVIGAVLRTSQHQALLRAIA